MFTKKRSAGTDFESNASTPPPPPLRPISSGCRGDDECSGVSSASDGRQVCGTRCACKLRHQGIGLCDPNICHCNCDIPGLRPFKTNLVPLLGLAIQNLSATLSQSQTNSTPATTKKRGPKKRGTSSRRNNVNESSADHSAASRIFNTVQRASQPVPTDEAKQSNVASIQSAVASSPSPTFILLTALQQQARAIDSVNQRLGVIGQLSIKNAEALNRMGFIQSDIQHSIHRYLASSNTNTFIPSNIPPNSSSSSASLHPSPSSSAPSSDPHDHHRSNNDSNNQNNRSSLQQLLQHLKTISGRSAEICEKIIMELLKKSRLNAFTAAELMEAAKVAGIDINHL